MRWYAQASNSVHKRKSLFSSLSFPLKLNDRYVCLNSRASFTLCARAKIAPQKPHKFNYCCYYCYTQSFFFFHHTNFFLLYFICAKQQSTVLFFFRMHVDNAKEQCVSINIVIYLLLNAFKWQNSRKTVLFFSWFANWKCNASSWFHFSLSFCVILARFSMCNTQNWKLHSWNFSQTPHQHATTKVWVYEHTTEHWWMK